MKILYICTHNRCRSILSEAITNHFANDHIQAKSAGSQPAGEACPVWFGQSIKVHWGLADPSKLSGTDEEIAAAFRDCIEEIKHRVNQLQGIAEQSLPQSQLKRALNELVN